MKKVSILIAAIAATALLAGCGTHKPMPGHPGKPGMRHHDVKGAMMDTKGELRMK